MWMQLTLARALIAHKGSCYLSIGKEFLYIVNEYFVF